MDAPHGRSRKGTESRISPVEGFIVVFGESETIVPGPLCVLHQSVQCAVNCDPKKRQRSEFWYSNPNSTPSTPQRSRHHHPRSRWPRQRPNQLSRRKAKENTSARRERAKQKYDDQHSVKSEIYYLPRLDYVRAVAVVVAGVCRVWFSARPEKMLQIN